MKNVVYNQKINIAESVHLPFARMLALNVITSLNSGNNEVSSVRDKLIFIIYRFV